MRIKITLKGEKNLFCHFNYNQSIVAFIYNILGDDFLIDNHNETFKFFTFSNIYIDDYVLRSDGMISKSGIISFYISSPSIDFISSLVDGLCMIDDVILFNKHLIISNIDFISYPKFNKNSNIFKTLSPIIIRSSAKETTAEGRGGKQYDLNPEEELFYNRLENNMKSKFCQYYGLEECFKDIHISFAGDFLKSKRISFLNNGFRIFNRAYLLNLKICGDEDLIKFAYDVGLGERNSSGFGMVK